MKKILTISSILLLILLGVFFLAFNKDINIFTTNTGTKTTNVDNLLKTTNIPETDYVCKDLYQDYIVKNGVDYNECLIDYDLKASTCGDVADVANINKNIIILLDSSGSMASKINGKTKIDIAKETIQKFIGDIPEDLNIGVITYGHKGSNNEIDKEYSCSFAELIQPISANHEELISLVEKIEYKGWTPLALAIKKTADIINSSDENTENYVYIISDGLETCGGNPVEEAGKILSKNPNTIINVVGFDIGLEESDSLQKIAAAGLGTFYTAMNSAELNRVFDSYSEKLRNLNCKLAETRKSIFKNSQNSSQVYSCMGKLTDKYNKAKEPIILQGFKYSKTDDAITDGYCKGLTQSKCRECVTYLSKQEIERTNVNMAILRSFSERFRGEYQKDLDGYSEIEEEQSQIREQKTN